MQERRADDLDRHGVLRTPADGVFEARRFDPLPELADVVDWAWTVEWDRRGGPPHDQATITAPVAHLTVEDGRAWLYGPFRGRFDVTLRDRGRVVGLRLTIGALRGLIDRPVAELADARFDAGLVRGIDATALAHAVEAEPDLVRAVAALQRHVADALAPGRRAGDAAPAPGAAGDAPGATGEAPGAANGTLLALDADGRLARDAVALLQADRTIVRVDQLAERLHVSPRTLQRLFTEHVGLGPAGVVRRFRLQDALQRALSGDAVDWARVATDLGYYDQAHLVREFTAAVGQPPARYARAG